MNLNIRLKKLEQQVPPVPEPKADLSGLSIEELRFLEQYIANDENSEEIQCQIEAICEKIVWR